MVNFYLKVDDVQTKWMKILWQMKFFGLTVKHQKYYGTRNFRSSKVHYEILYPV